jgi:hypothetical protein
MVDEAAEKRLGVFLQQHRRRCPHENGGRRGLGSSASLTRTGDDGLTTSVGAAAQEGAATTSSSGVSTMERR